MTMGFTKSFNVLTLLISFIIVIFHNSDAEGMYMYMYDSYFYCQLEYYYFMCVWLHVAIPVNKKYNAAGSCPDTADPDINFPVLGKSMPKIRSNGLMVSVSKISKRYCS